MRIQFIQLNYWSKQNEIMLLGKTLELQHGLHNLYDNI